MGYSSEYSSHAKNVHWWHVDKFKELATWETEGSEGQFLVPLPLWPTTEPPVFTFYVTADCVPDMKTSHCLHWRSANFLSYYSTVRKLNNFENLCRYMAQVRQPRNRGQIPNRAREFPLPQNMHTGSGAYPASNSIHTRDSSRGKAILEWSWPLTSIRR